MMDVKIFNFENKLTWSGLFFWRKVKRDKSNIRILFIDNEDMPVVDNLKKAGWSVQKVRDVKNLDDDSVRTAHIIFVDYKGVGRIISPKMEGIGLIDALKNQYLDSKRVILYSAIESFSRDVVFDGLVERADNKIRKNADTREFINMINSEVSKLK